MNIYSLSEDSVALNEIGYALDTPERIKLQMGLLRLTELANSDQLLFWGKIFTTSQPYYIASAIDFKSQYAFPHKKFFYSTDNFNFKQLPELDKFNQDKANQFNSLPFTGNPANILINIQVQGEQNKSPEKAQNVEQADSDEQVQKIEPKNLTQQDRLSYTVRSIQIQCQIVPKGAYRMIVQHQIRYDNNYKASTDYDLKNFVHFRYPETEESKRNLESPQSIFRTDIFDPIENSLFWSIQPNTEYNLVTVRSFLWPGYLSYVFTKRHVFGGIYFGNGLKNVDLPFYL